MAASANRDMQIMRRKGRSWRISLGYYRNKKLAELRHRKFSALGVETVMSEHTKSRVSWWLDLVPAGADMTDEALHEVLDGIVVGRVDVTPTSTVGKLAAIGMPEGGV